MGGAFQNCPESDIGILMIGCATVHDVVLWLLITLGQGLDFSGHSQTEEQHHFLLFSLLVIMFRINDGCQIPMLIAKVSFGFWSQSAEGGLAWGFRVIRPPPEIIFGLAGGPDNWAGAWQPLASFGLLIALQQEASYRSYLPWVWGFGTPPPQIWFWGFPRATTFFAFEFFVLYTMWDPWRENPDPLKKNYTCSW